MYDLVDEGANESHDNISLGIGPILDVLTGSQVTTAARTSIFSFIDGIKALYPEFESEIDELTTNKGIDPIIDEWGTGSNAYLNMSSSSVVNTTLNLTDYENDLSGNKHIKYLATSTSTTLNFSGNDKFLVNIIYKNSMIFSSCVIFNKSYCKYLNSAW